MCVCTYVSVFVHINFSLKRIVNNVYIYRYIYWPHFFMDTYFLEHY